MIRLSEQSELGKPISLHDAAEIAEMREVCRLAASCLDMIAREIRPGLSTADIDRLCESFMRDHGAVPATIGFHGYRHASCVSVNHVVTHGIPSETKILQEGDIVNVDVTPKMNGWHGDSSRMYILGKSSRLAQRLVAATHAAMMAGIEAVSPGNTLGDVGNAIEQVAKDERFSVVHDFCGHGIGREFHAAPQVLHYGKPGRGLVLEEGMTFTIEPMLNAGRPEVKVLSDGWTAVTRDRSLSAQYEHTVVVTADGVEILTTSSADRVP